MRYQEVEENTALIFTCDQYSGFPTWVLKVVTGSTTTIVPAVVSQPTTPIINRQNSGYTLPVSAAITRIYSSRGLYSCAGKLGSSSQPGTLDLSPTASDTSNTADRSGRCDVTMSIPATSGTYTCSVTVNPGNTQTSCGSFTITRPSLPTISCPSDFIPENTTLTCTCNANNIGQPGGHLRWYTGTGSDFSTEVVSANYDVTTLEMTRTVKRGDNDRKFRCVNNWTVKVNTASDYTASVAWGPGTVSIDGNTLFYTDTTGSKVMTLTCEANKVNPSSALTYNWDVLCDDKQQNTCTFRPRPGPNGDDNTVITCTVTNSKNNNKQRQKSVTLDIKYPRPSAPQISGYVNGQVLYEGDNLTLTCAVTGGDPKVTSVTLTCPGRSKKKTTNGQSSSLEFSPLSSSDHNLTCVCTGQWDRESHYTLTDSRTLTVYYRTSDTKLTINSQNNITVREKEAVTLTCQSRGRPAPELKLLQRGVELARHNGGQLSLSEERSQLSHNTTARCDNTGIITCHASNGMESAQNISVQLYVNCKPRSITAVPVPPKVNFINKPVTAAFDLEAFPLPDNFTFQYLGSTQNSRGSQPVPASIELRAECSNTYADFAVRCNVSLDKAKDSTAEGFYTFTAANAFGEGQFVFQVTLNANADEGINNAAIGGGIAAGLFVLIVVVLVCFCCRRRKQQNSEHSESRPPNRDSREEPQAVRPVSDIYEMAENGSPRHHTENQPPSVYTSLETSDIGVPSVYSHVTPYGNGRAAADLPQENQPPSVYTSLETSDIGVPSVYSHVTSYGNGGAAADLPQGPVYENTQVENRGPIYENTQVENRGEYVNVRNNP
ncbi:hypothetical protein ACOMHN_061827 [Nucella lapillus]